MKIRREVFFSEKDKEDKGSKKSDLRKAGLGVGLGTLGAAGLVGLKGVLKSRAEQELSTTSESRSKAFDKFLDASSHREKLLKRLSERWTPDADGRVLIDPLEISEVVSKETDYRKAQELLKELGEKKEAAVDNLYGKGDFLRKGLGLAALGVGTAGLGYGAYKGYKYLKSKKAEKSEEEKSPKSKQFTQWDETDNLKRAKDSDILAEKKVRGTSWGKVGKAALLGAAGGGGFSLFRQVRGGQPLSLKGAKTAAILGGLVGAGAGYLSQGKEREQADFYNNRLEYAKMQALRRERKDWRTQMTQRDGYSY